MWGGFSAYLRQVVNSERTSLGCAGAGPVAVTGSNLRLCKFCSSVEHNYNNVPVEVSAHWRALAVLFHPQWIVFFCAWNTAFSRPASVLPRKYRYRKLILSNSPNCVKLIPEHLQLWDRSNRHVGELPIIMSSPMLVSWIACTQCTYDLSFRRRNAKEMGAMKSAGPSESWLLN